MNKKTLSLILISILVYLSATILLQPRIKSVLRVANPTPTPVLKEENKSRETINYKCEKDKTAFELLEKNSESVETKDYSFGRLVTSINDIKGGTDGKYWTYFIDDKSATVSADNYKCADSEKVEWKFGKENQ